VRGVYRFIRVPRFFENYHQLTELPSGVLIRVLVQEYKGYDEITRQEGNFVT
jgi:hypothetical protein